VGLIIECHSIAEIPLNNDEIQNSFEIGIQKPHNVFLILWLITTAQFASRFACSTSKVTTRSKKFETTHQRMFVQGEANDTRLKLDLINLRPRPSRWNHMVYCDEELITLLARGHSYHAQRGLSHEKTDPRHLYACIYWHSVGRVCERGICPRR
jgi:hypothetical protein